MQERTHQRMFHGYITAAALADQLAARFHERHYHTNIRNGSGTALIQIGSKHGTPVTLNIADTQGGVLVTMSADRGWLDYAGDLGGMIDRAASGNLLSLVGMVPDLIAELKKENLGPAIWDAVNDICAMTRALAGEENAPKNPKICPYCQTSNPPENTQCESCGGALPDDLPRECPKCGRRHTADALFCQACGTRLVSG